MIALSVLRSCLCQPCDDTFLILLLGPAVLKAARYPAPPFSQVAVLTKIQRPPYPKAAVRTKSSGRCCQKWRFLQMPAAAVFKNSELPNTAEKSSAIAGKGRRPLKSSARQKNRGEIGGETAPPFSERRSD